jgi:hypothetical protein
MIERFENVRLEIDPHRWYIKFRITRQDGEVIDLVASADSGVTYGDQIWFGTAAEYEEAAR